MLTIFLLAYLYIGGCFLFFTVYSMVNSRQYTSRGVLVSLTWPVAILHPIIDGVVEGFKEARKK